ncbi:DUF2290 domain-containing protein [Rhizobium brockwellii]|uniref:DUF2290 domain-containing protein n=1 Tax=Rhizobium brockwellii TaxID=3019932 RepID=UPI003F9BC972
MNKAEWMAEIRKVWDYAKALQVDEVFSGPVALEASEEFKRVAVDPSASYEDLYLTGLRESQYNILLKDYSFFQFGAGGDDGVRFAYYPNPFFGAAKDAVSELSEMQEFVAEGIIGVDEFLHRVSEVRRSQHPPLVRYDYALEQYVEATHPCSHLHLGFHGENRWAVRRYLTATAFALLVFRLFYLDYWMAAAPVRRGEQDLSMDNLLEIAKAESRMLYANEFSAAEERRFHLA